jgi:DtxR family transcriptional regulator, Mn-dependent transcriptional regulator
MPTPTLEEYLETIYKLGLEGPVRPTQIAEAIGVSGPTVTATLKRLMSRGLVTREGTDVVLTAEGVERSVDIVRKHRIAERFLVDTLGFDWQEAHEDACLLEHALSDRVLAALERHLNNPDVCPHGHPIPSVEGVVSQVAGRPLSELGVGHRATVLRVAEDENLLGYLGELGLRPGAQVEVVEAQPFGGPLTIETVSGRRPLALEVASHVVVQEADE